MKTRLYNNDQCMSFRNCFYMSVGKTNMPVTAGNRYKMCCTDENKTIQ